MAVAIATGDLAVPVVNAEFRSLVAANFPPALNGGPLGVKMAARTACAASFYIPPAIRIGNDMMGF